MGFVPFPRAIQFSARAKGPLHGVTVGETEKDDYYHLGKVTHGHLRPMEC